MGGNGIFSKTNFKVRKLSYTGRLKFIPGCYDIITEGIFLGINHQLENYFTSPVP